MRPWAEYRPVCNRFLEWDMINTSTCRYRCLQLQSSSEGVGTVEEGESSVASETSAVLASWNTSDRSSARVSCASGFCSSSVSAEESALLTSWVSAPTSSVGFVAGSEYDSSSAGCHPNFPNFEIFTCLDRQVSAYAISEVTFMRRLSVRNESHSPQVERGTCVLRLRARFCRNRVCEVHEYGLSPCISYRLFKSSASMQSAHSLGLSSTSTAYLLLMTSDCLLLRVNKFQRGFRDCNSNFLVEI